MKGDLRSAFAIENLKRAWLWTLTNPEAQYKNHFRQVYKAFAFAEESNLRDMQRRLTQETFEPTHATKIYFPKKSGLQRTFSLLAIEDQIVYQALVNEIAEKLYPEMKHRYYRSVFGNLYAGKRSMYFFNDWHRGYTKFSKSIRAAYNKGLRYSASFDLTACYDSIDHAVLKHFLKQLGLDAEFCLYLTRLLSHWTASSSAEPIYHGHGIPQGPLASGLLAESVLSHFDKAMTATAQPRYFRYVDDIRLFAKTEKELRYALVKLDLLSREVGLFPQSSKIEIHKVVDIESEIRSISNPPEELIRGEFPNQDLIRKRLMELSRNLIVKNETRFKYVLGRAAPNAELLKRLLKVVEHQPHLYVSIFRYLQKHKKLSKVASRQSLDLLYAYDLYPAFSATLVSSLRGSVHGYAIRRLRNYCNVVLRRRNLDLNLRVASCNALLGIGGISRRTLLQNARSGDWWVRTSVLPNIQKRDIDEVTYFKILNKTLRDSTLDSAIVAAELCIENCVPIEDPVSEIQKAAQVMLKESGLIGKISDSVCAISNVMIEILGKQVAPINWRRVLGKRYKEVLPKVMALRAYSKSDASGFVNVADTVNEYILDELYKHDTSLGSYKLGQIGSNLSSTRLAAKYPDLLAAAKAIHDARLESQLSHPIVKSTGKPTRRIRFHELVTLRRKLRKGYLELWRLW